MKSREDESLRCEDEQKRTRIYKRRQSQTTPPKLKLLFTIVNRSKGEFYADMLSQFDVNLQLGMIAQGTAKTEMLELLGLSDNGKTLIVSAIRDDRVDLALRALDEKFRTVKNGRGIAFTVPMDSVIGVMIYQFLSYTGN